MTPIEIRTKTIVKVAVVGYITIAFVHGIDRGLGKELNPKIKAWAERTTAKYSQ